MQLRTNIINKMVKELTFQEAEFTRIRSKMSVEDEYNIFERFNGINNYTASLLRTRAKIETLEWALGLNLGKGEHI